MLLRLTAVLVVLSLLPAASAAADPGASPSGDAAQSQYGGTPPQPVPQPGNEGPVQAEDEVEPGEDETGAGDEEGSGEDLPEQQADGTDEGSDGAGAGAPGTSGGAGGSGATPDEVAAEVRDVAGGATGQGGTLPFTGSATLLALAAGALLVTAGLATRRIGRAA